MINICWNDIDSVGLLRNKVSAQLKGMVTNIFLGSTPNTQILILFLSPLIPIALLFLAAPLVRTSDQVYY